ncbi:MAG: HlyC/CorC family transporter [Acidobacteria bacterium]|nr:HlyC/CorC family transporter [Acidobacteriota bacterium]
MNVVFKLLVVLLLVLANAFFVAVEFAMVSVRRSKIEVLATTGKRSAQSLLRALDHLDEMISATQFGITIASLALGWIGEETIAHLAEPLLLKYLPDTWAAVAAHGTASFIALAVVTYLHLVIGEYVPKALAIEYSDRFGLLVAQPMEWFYKTFKPFIWIINVSGLTVLRVLGVKTQVGHQSAYTGEEIRHLINVSHQSGNIEADERTLIHNVFNFADLAAREIIIPRTQVAAIDESATYEEVVRTFQTSGYSRLPVYRDNFDNVIGILHHKDVMQSVFEPQSFDLKAKVHPPVFIHDSARLVDVLQKMQREHLHLAIVVDEHGGVEGILTLEDLLEEIVGEIQDEHDESTAEKVRERSDGTFILDGGLTIREANRKFDLQLPESDDYATLAGFLIAREGRLLAEGDAVNYNGVRFIVERLNQRRIARVRMQQLESAPTLETITSE